MFTKSQAAIRLLNNRGLLETSVLDLVAVRKQMVSYHALIERAKSNNELLNFLAEYDALMRLTEVILICSGFRLGSQPHRVMKDLVETLVVNSEILEVCKARHEAKKKTIKPSKTIHESLTTIRSQVEAEVSRETETILNY